jgi:predicted nucleic acid-binding protein
MDHSAVKAHYYDASALVKIVADDADEDPGRTVLRQYRREHPHPAHTTSLCIAEAFGAFKRKFLRRTISEQEYVTCIKNFIRVIGNTFQMDDSVPILLPLVTREVERLVAKYKIDFVDCFQIVTIMQGQFRILVGESQSILITADRELAKAARAEKARVWECTSEAAPK